MRTELWGLRDKETHEPIYTYFASSNPHRALFANKKSAERACQYPGNKRYEPFAITGNENIDPIHAAGGCYCRECRHCLIDLSKRKRHLCMEYMRRRPVSLEDFCSHGERKDREHE